MQTTIARDPVRVQRGTMTVPLGYEDPIDIDHSEDVAVVTTARGLCRIALVAAQTAARFASENSPYDPMAWMLAPRQLFGGGNALKACLEREACMRAMLLHGLALGMDADPNDLDDLFDDDGDDDTGHKPNPSASDGGFVHGSEDGTPRLFTAMVAYRGDGLLLQAFHASVATSVNEVAARLRARHGTVIAACATITVGFDRAHRFAKALVAPAIADLLVGVELDPMSPVAAGLDLNLEQRMDA